MPEGRSAVPAALRRQVLVEAGHRCAVPTCRQHPVDIEHINDWARVRKHEFENLIALCPTCHRRKGNGPDQIDRKALRQYKANLAVLNSRYGDLERRVIEIYAGMLRNDAVDPANMVPLSLGAGSWLHLMYLVQDGYLARVQWEGGIRIDHVLPVEKYQLTPAGAEFVQRWAAAQPLDPQTDDGA
ncbi:HNH endonuclease [Kitasatospora sp. NPDC058218]|uniref:HNH endonuclease n=1 Tax=Kitasatospora sp. NPDC058218 TaxID=3346385 RepID=UPI0036DA4084